jgi:MFS family permease
MAIGVNFFAVAGVYFFMSFLATGALIGYRFLSQKMPIVALELIFLLQGAGMGIVMPTATESAMSVVPRERGRAIVLAGEQPG